MKGWKSRIMVGSNKRVKYWNYSG